MQPLPDKPRFGQPIAEADVAAWNIDVRTSDGRGLPSGRGTVAEGRKVYDAKCVSCHGPDAKGGPVYGAMVGGIGSFTTGKRVVTPGSMYPYAPILFDYIRRSMPMDAPQTLSANEVYAVSAYLLHLNGLLPADAAVDQTSLPACGRRKAVSKRNRPRRQRETRMSVRVTAPAAPVLARGVADQLHFDFVVRVDGGVVLAKDREYLRPAEFRWHFAAFR